MINQKIHIKYFTLIIALLSNYILFAQVGIQNKSPNPFAILDLKANNKGVLIPRVTTAQRDAMKTSCTPTCPNSLLVYDTDKEAYFYFNNNDWQLLNPWIAPDSNTASSEDIETSTLVDNVGISKTPDNGYKLDVEGNTYVRGNIDASSHVNINSGNVQVDNGNINISNGSVSARDNITSNNGYFEGPNYSSNPSTSFKAGPVPKGGIIMWSGSTVPSGWGLCDGSTPGAPNLSGKFIIGSGSRSRKTDDQGSILSGTTESFTLHDEGGADYVTLKSSELPPHNHSGNTDYSGSHRHLISAGRVHLDSSDDGACMEDIGGSDGSFSLSSSGTSHSHSINCDLSGGGESHYNVPPYYVLAYIIKL